MGADIQSLDVESNVEEELVEPSELGDFIDDFFLDSLIDTRNGDEDCRLGHGDILQETLEVSTKVGDGASSQEEDTLDGALVGVGEGEVREEAVVLREVDRSIVLLEDGKEDEGIQLNE